MNKIPIYFVILVSLFSMLCGCQRAPQAADTVHHSSPSEIVAVDSAEQETLSSEIKVLYGTYWYSYMENPQWKHEGDVIPTAEAALRIAKDVFYAMSEEKPHINDYQPKGIMYDEPHGYWIVLFQKPPSKPGTLVLGDAYSVVLQKSDGRVVQISWSE